MVCSMTRSKVKVTSPSKLEIRPFQKLSPLPFTKLQWQLATDHGFLNYGTISKFLSGQIFDIWISFCVT